MLVAIPFRVCRAVRQAKVSREVDNLRCRRLLQQLPDYLLRSRMRQGAERDLESHIGPINTVDRDKLWQREWREMRKYLAHRLAGTALGRQQSNLGARVTQQHAHKLAAGVTGGAQHTDLRFVSHGSSLKELPEEGQQRGLDWGHVPQPQIRRHGRRNATPVPRWHGNGGDSFLRAAWSCGGDIGRALSPVKNGPADLLRPAQPYSRPPRFMPRLEFRSKRRALQPATGVQRSRTNG